MVEVWVYLRLVINTIQVNCFSQVEKVEDIVVYLNRQVERGLDGYTDKNIVSRKITTLGFTVLYALIG